MKKLFEFIQESLQINEAIENVFNLKEEESREVFNNIVTFCNSMKGQKVSLNDQTKLKTIFNQFISKSTWPKNMVYQVYRKYGLATVEGFRGFFLSNHDNLEKYKVYIDWIKQFDLSEIEKQYQSYKNSKDYVQGIKWEDTNPEEVEERDLVVYDRWNPDVFEVFPFKGKRSKDTEKQVNMFRMDFHYDYDVKYYDCYPILAKNYFGREEELKKRAELQLGYDDPNEFK